MADLVGAVVLTACVAGDRLLLPDTTPLRCELDRLEVRLAGYRWTLADTLPGAGLMWFEARGREIVDGHGRLALRFEPLQEVWWLLVNMDEGGTVDCREWQDATTCAPLLFRGSWERHQYWGLVAFAWRSAGVGWSSAGDSWLMAHPWRYDGARLTLDYPHTADDSLRLELRCGAPA